MLLSPDSVFFQNSCPTKSENWHYVQFLMISTVESDLKELNYLQKRTMFKYAVVLLIEGRWSSSEYLYCSNKILCSNICLSALVRVTARLVADAGLHDVDTRRSCSAWL